VGEEKKTLLEVPVFKSLREKGRKIVFVKKEAADKKQKGDPGENLL